MLKTAARAKNRLCLSFLVTIKASYLNFKARRR